VSPAEEIVAAVEALTGDAPVYAPGTARIVSNPAENELIISVCDQHGETAPAARFDANGHCGDCVFVRLHAGDSRFARQLAGLINARPSLTALLNAMAAEIHRLAGDLTDAELAKYDPMAPTWMPALAVARHINDTFPSS
jgi:hypothetical protein